MTSWFAELAMLPSGLARDVRFDIADGRFTAVRPNARPTGAIVLAGMALPGFANCHSHAFHRALRGRTHDRGGTFWTWRERMYELAGHLDPDTYLALARATYAEMALAGVTTVGEFHYLHHGPGGRPYVEANVMAHALRDAASQAGIRLTLLDTCYLAGGLRADGHRPLDDVQRRFADADVDAWAARAAQLEPSDGVRIGAAIHSVRAVPKDALPIVRVAAQARPLHVHLSEQPAENDACIAHYGLTPTALLAGAGVLGTTTSAVHATHLTDADIQALGSTRTTACLCPSTERDLADGIGPGRALADAGSPISLGTDQHATIDLFDDARSLELHERLATLHRGRFTPDELLRALSRHASIGWPDAGRLEVGARADVVAVRLDSVRTAGCDPAQVVFAAATPDVDTVAVDGRFVVRDGHHLLGDIGAQLRDAIGAAWERTR